MILSCDPGMSGGWGWEFKGKVYVENMQQTPKDILYFLCERDLEADSYENIVCYIERVGGYVKGNSGPASTTFARHVGNLEMALLALNLEHHWVLPSTWMHAFIGKQKYPPSMTPYQRKAKRKNLIKAKAQGLFPNIKVNLKIADALGILTYGREL